MFDNSIKKHNVKNNNESLVDLFWLKKRELKMAKRRKKKKSKKKAKKRRRR